MSVCQVVCPRPPAKPAPQGAVGPLGTLPLPRPPWLQERQRMSDRLEDTSLRLKDEMDLYKRMMDKLRHNRLEFQKEREATQEVGRQAPGRPPPSNPCSCQPASFPRSSSRTCGRSWSTCRCTSWTASGRAGAAARPPASASSTPGPERSSWSTRSSGSSR